MISVPRFTAQVIKTALHRDGLGIGADQFNQFLCSGVLQWALLNINERRTKNEKQELCAMSDVEKAYQEATEVISNAEAMYQKALGGFRSQIRNDIASIAASAQKVVTEAGKMQAAYLATANTLTTPQITEAIANAERLATALKAISELSQTKVAFAVMNGSGSA